MIQPADIHPVTSFIRDHRTHMKRLAETGRPEVLTLNGKASIVIQDAAAYQKLLEQLDELDVVRILHVRHSAQDELADP
ncbi:type II toxin-antitoxin system Phd/YefM family antitoxin [Mucisphaera calidilacus]|uniref:Antitoxin n=1 Tax=Mucisphaera calidilacus TaxID=2527982 RepID=A0A518BY84_9BACT|nr:type II toxin-antitoxin system Phd/YefM family antitoxin [Mucisphaera calidilacus]QDU71916.1 hypothetical protein Pan265_17750 [Mucisphaera calidilacus]